MNEDSFKPINTIYNGYNFRSRLEARWAVFFDFLNVRYEYEPEGFEMNGTKYLPDFWLPNCDIWVEIKGKEPTHSEKIKSSLLAKGSNKNVFMSIGNPWLQTHEMTIKEYIAEYKTPEYRIIGFLSDHVNIQSPSLHDFCIFKFESLVEYLKEKEKEGFRFSCPVPEFKELESIYSLLIELDNEYYPQKHGKIHPRHQYGDIHEKLLWAIINEKLFPEQFTSALENEFTNPKLVKAYYAARSARFEYGESPKYT